MSKYWKRVKDSTLQCGEGKQSRTRQKNEDTKEEQEEPCTR